MAQTLIIISGAVAADGQTVTLNIGGVSGSLLPSSGITGINITADNSTMLQGSQSSSGSVVTIEAAQFISYASEFTVNAAFAANGSNLVDTSGNTAVLNGPAVVLVNNSDVNTYIQIPEFLQRYDRNTMLQLSGDDKSRQGNLPNLQEVLNDQAGELESAVDGRYNTIQVRYLWPMPRVLKRWVGIRARASLFSRRSVKPRGVAADVEWAEKWIDGIINGTVNIPGISHFTGIRLLRPPRTQFDHIFAPVRGQTPYW